MTQNFDEAIKNLDKNKLHYRILYYSMFVGIIPNKTGIDERSIETC